MILTQWASIFAAVIFPLPTTSTRIPQQYPGCDLNPSITFGIVDVTHIELLEYYYHAVRNELMWGKRGTITESDVRVKFEETSTFYLHIQSGIIAYSPSPMDNAGEFIKIDGNNSQSILENSYISRADLESQAETLNGRVYSFPPEYLTDQSPPLDDYVWLGAVTRTHNISAVTVERVNSNEVLLTIPHAMPRTPSLRDAIQTLAHRGSPLKRIMKITKWQFICRFFGPLVFGVACGMTGSAFKTGDNLSLGLYAGASVFIFAVYNIVGSILTLLSRDLVVEMHDQQLEMENRARTEVGAVTVKLARPGARRSRQDGSEIASSSQ